MKHTILTGIAVALFAVGMTASGTAAAHAHPEPTVGCNSNNAGASATTSYNDGYYTYYYTYICNPDEWVLVDVLQCSNTNGRCEHW